VEFDGLFKGRLEANDHIVFAQTPGQGLAVSVNNVQLGRIADDQFFPYAAAYLDWPGSLILNLP
jgi:hypothetical protein